MHIDEAAEVEFAPATFESFVEAHQDALLRFGWLLTGDQSRAQDLVQDALVRVLPHWSRIGKGGEAGPYVRRVMANLNRSWWRRGPARREIALDDDQAASAGLRDQPDRPAQINDRLDLQRALGQLPPGQRAVVVLRYYEGYSEAEVAQLLGCRVGTVKSQSAKGLKRLREHLDATGRPAPEGSRTRGEER